MSITRREFIKWSGAAGFAAAAMSLGIDLKPVEIYAAGLTILKAKETTSICPYCAVGCGIIVHTKPNGTILNTEGDPDHPINEGALCAKGAALYQMTVNKSRLKNVLYRPPHGDDWEEVEWDWALEKIASNIKTTRDSTFSIKNDKNEVVNRTTAIAHIGSAALDNEECWLLQAIMRAMGLVYIEHQARI
jgi:formate dehydrogenase major subunit